MTAGTVAPPDGIAGVSAASTRGDRAARPSGSSACCGRAVGLLLAVPMLRRLRRRSGSWMVPGAALAATTSSGRLGAYTLGGYMMPGHEHLISRRSVHRPARRRPALRDREGGRRAGARPPAGRARRRRQPGRADRDGDLRPRADLGRGAARLGRGVRLPLRRPVGARPRLRPAGRAPRPRACRTTTPRCERADDAHGHGHGGHAGMSMEAMARDMRNRFLVALVFTIPIVALVDGRHEAARHRARDAVRHRPRRLAAPAQPAGRPLRLVDLLHRRGRRAAQRGRWT